MSGMKFRLQCANCNSVFFSQDRKARYCPKCIKKRSAKPAVEKIKEHTRTATPRSAEPGQAAVKPQRVATAVKTGKESIKTSPKFTELTPELYERIKQIYREQYAESEVLPRELIAKISDALWLNRKVVGAAIYRISHPQVEITPELESRIIELYNGYVVKGERPPEGRRKRISQMVGVPLWQVKNIVYKWSQSQYAESAVPEHTREQKFEIEKQYWEELAKGRYRLNEIPGKIAERLEFATPYQIMRWLDKLHDDDVRFKNVADVPPETERLIEEAYRQYLLSPKPPEQGLHSTIVQQISGITTRQVHMVLQKYRKKMRAEYPLQ